MMYFMINALQFHNSIINMIRQNLLRYRIYTGSNALKNVISLMFEPEKEVNKSITPISLQLNDLVPDFFTNDIKCYGLSTTGVVLALTNTPSNSFVRFQIPLGTNANSRLPFERFSSKQIRIGRILEIMDSLAGFSIFKFAIPSTMSFKQNLFTIATACIDNIFIEDNITCEEDIVIQSNVNFVGSTSGEVQVNLIQSGALKASAFFTMVSRDPSNIGKGGKGYKLPQLAFKDQVQIQKCHQREKRGENSRKLRLERAKKSLEAQIPSQQQITLLHSFFLKRNAFASTLRMADTITNKSLLMQSQYRNMNNKIFGGFLMREMIETAWIAAKRLVGDSDIFFERLEDIFFIQPVEIGEGVDIKAQVVYTDDIFLVIKVEANKILFKKNPENIKACQLYITFSDVNKLKVPKLHPQTYSQGVQYLMGRRVLTGSEHSILHK